VFAAADRLRREVSGDTVTYVVNRNIQYTNVCYFRCGFCAFSKGRLAANLRGAPYLVPLDEIVRRMGRFSRLTRPFNALGLPAVALPGGFSADGRPLGLQIVARPFDEATALRLAHAYEQATAWPTRRPPE
jgi:hypothetical protein